MNPKDQKKIEIMKTGGKKLIKVFHSLVKLIKPRINFLQIEKEACKLIKEEKGVPAFKLVSGYNWATCLNVNQGIVHGVPKNYSIKKKDIVSLDIGMFYQGFFTDMCGTFYVKDNQSFSSSDNKKDREIRFFLETGKKALKKAINQAKPDNRIGHISSKIQKTIEHAGFNCARVLTGHGVGKKLHQKPIIPCILNEKIENTPILEAGMTLAIEVIYTQGKPDLITDPKDRWTIYTKDGKISAVFEKTIAVTSNGFLTLTKGDY